MSTFPCDIPDDKYRKCATKNEAMASAKDEDGLHVGFQNNFTAEAIKIINSQINQGMKFSRSQDDQNTGAFDKVTAKKQNIDLEKNGCYFQNTKEGISPNPPDHKKSNLTSSSKLEDVHSLSNIRVCKQDILKLDNKLTNSIWSVKADIKIKEGIATDPNKLMYTSKQLQDGHTLINYAPTCASGAYQTKSSIAKDLAHIPQTSSANEIFLTKSYQTPNLTHSSAVMSGNTITFSEKIPPTNADVLGASNGVQATLGTSGGTTPVLIFSEGVPVSTAAIASMLYLKNSENTKILDKQQNIFTCENPLTASSIATANLDKADGDSKSAPNSAKSAQAFLQFSIATAHPESQTAAACDSANTTCLDSKLASNFFANFNRYSCLDPAQMSNKVDSARLACQGEKSCQVLLDSAVFQKQSKILPNLEGNLDSPAVTIGSRANKTIEKVYQKKINPCQCLVAELANNLTRHFESSYFRTMQIGDTPRAQTITLNDTVSKDCGQHYWQQLCGQLKFTAVSSYSRLFGSLAWEEHHPSTQVRGRRLANVSIPSGSCTGSPENFNLLDTSVSALQSYGRNDNMNTNARVGCDGVMQLCYPTYNTEKAVGVCKIPATVLIYWVATFAQSTWIQSIVYIQNYSSDPSIIEFFVGDLSTNGYRDNQQCIGPKMIPGFTNCGRQGKYLALTSNTFEFGFLEVMAYSEFFIHHNAQNSILSSTMVDSPTTTAFQCQINQSCQARWVRSQIIKTTTQHGWCCIYSQEQTDPTLIVTYKADVAIKFVTIIPSDQCSTDVMIWQTNIEVWIKNQLGTQWQCGGLMADYNTYKEFPCNQVGNQIVVKRPGTAKQLSMAGTGIFSECICSSSSFDPFLFTNLTSYAFSGLSTDALKTVKVMPDTVSSVCGNADGYSYCPHSVSFIDSTTGSPVTLPLNGFSYDSATSVVTLNPAQALPFFRVTASVSIPGTSPLVTHNQSLTWNLFKPSTPAATIIKSLSSTALTITWVAPADGNSPITGYTVYIKKKDGTYTTYPQCTGTVLTCTIPHSVLKATPYNLVVGDSVYTKVLATNYIGSSVASSEGNGAIIPATEPVSPGAPTATILGTNVLITWKTPADGGSAITGYTLAIRQSDGVTFTALASCTGTTASCVIPLSVLKAEPYNLAEGASIYATVLAKNFVGSSSASIPGSGAEITKTPNGIYIPKQSLDAFIGSEASLLLPEITGVSYIVLSNPEYTVLLTNNLLKVKSDSFSDVGSHDLLIIAQTSTQSIIFTVDLTLKNPAIYAENEATYASKASNTAITESIPLSVQQTGYLLQTTASCTTNNAEILSCVTASGFLYSIDPNKTAKSGNSEEVKPTLSVSKVDTKGQFFFKFSQAMKTEALRNTTNSRHLQEKNITGQNDTSDKYAYLLSPKHLCIEVKSENRTKHKFTWYAKAITNTSIEMQVDFEDPLYISNEPQSLDRLEITVLPPALSYFQTINSGALTKNPLQTFNQTLPPQVIRGKAIDLAGKAAEITAKCGQYTALANLAAQLTVSGSMAQMWSMVNALQIVSSFNYLRTNVPGNVRSVMSKLIDMLELSALPTDQITSQVFNFTQTQSPGAGFVEMGNDTKVLVLFMGKPFYIGVFILSMYMLYGLVHFSGKSNKTCEKLCLWLATKLIFGAALRYQMETYLDFGLGTFLKFEEPNLNTGSDIFDFGFSIVSIICLLLLPLTQVICLCKNKDQMDDRRFKSKWGTLYEGLKIFTPEQRTTAIKMLCWFIFRRIVTALNLVELRNQTVWLQLTFNMWLCLADACIILHWSPYETKLRNIMEKFNGAVVLLLSQLIYMQTDLILSSADRYQIGWYYLGVIGFMVLANFSVVVVDAVIGLAKKFKKRLAQGNQIKARALQKTNLTLDLKGALPPAVFVDGSLLSGRSKLVLEILKQLRKPEVDSLKLVYLQDRLVALDNNKLEKKRNIFQENQIESDIEMGSHRHAELLVDQISDFNFYEKQKAGGQQVSSEFSAIESESFQQSSNMDKSEQIDFETGPIASVRSKAELGRQPEEIQQAPSADYEIELWKRSDQPTVANKNASNLKEQKAATAVNDESTHFSLNQIIPAKKAKEPMLLEFSNQGLELTFGKIQKPSSELITTKRQRKKQILWKFFSALDPEEEEIKQQLANTIEEEVKIQKMEENKIILEAEIYAEQLEAKQHQKFERVRESRLERVRQCLDHLQMFDYNGLQLISLQEFSALLPGDFQLQSPKSQLREAKLLYELINEEPANQHDQNVMVMGRAKPQMILMQEWDECNSQPAQQDVNQPRQKNPPRVFVAKERKQNPFK